MKLIDAMRRMNKARILIVGDVIMDRYIWGEVRRISPEAPVPVIRVREESEVLGGAAHVAANLAGLNCSPVLIGVRGADEGGERILSLLQNFAIKQHLLTDPSRPTSTKTRIVGNGQQLLRIDEEVANPLGHKFLEQLKAKIREILSECHAVILSDYGKGTFTAPATARFLIRLAREHHVPVLVDPKGKNWDHYENATCITPNKKELEDIALFPLRDEKALLKAIHSVRKRYNLEWLLVTLGRHGMVLLGPEGKPLFRPALARDVYDVTGAGDTVVATLAAGIAVGLPFSEAAHLANIAAGIVVSKLGTQPIHLSELEGAFLANNNNKGDSIRCRKLLTLEAARIQVQAWRANDEKVVFTNGCFDLLHPGHIHLLHQARALGTKLIVGLNTDVSVRQLKGSKRPILQEADRAALLAALECVDLIVPFEERTPLALIEALRPDFLVKGADYSLGEVFGRNIVEAYGGKVILIPLLEDFSIGNIIQRFST